MSDLGGSGIVLASNSASRKAMLEAAGIAFEAEGAAVDERALEAEMEGAEPAEIAQALAAAKAAALSAARPDALVLGSDSLVEVDGRRFDKPANRDNAAEHLRFFSGKAMTLHSAAALARGGQIVWVGSDFARLRVRDLSEDFIAAYLDAEWPAVSYCVGVFRIEGPGVQLFESIAGDQFTVLGMPLLQVLDALRGEGALAS
ncbi:MAG: Maf family protein [Erythrobacter sp.]|jgi:septum formation protein|uniref:Maf family protein n=1 Tax=Qipengyuania TaxID=1855416 RepID=UPI0020A1EFDE|nr:MULTISPECIES: Maf family protein [Qipengyuania]MCP2018075.1 septum formation protein [Qipengyuania citrea]MDE0901991.1 Maf family protein [Erythrobacter sp.]WPL57329.1 Maf family protein [Qipengyuania sp. HL-TH5]